MSNSNNINQEMKLAITDYHNFNHQYQTTPPLSIPHLFQFFHKAIRISETLLSRVIIHCWDRHYLTKYLSNSDFKACTSSNIQDSVDHTLKVSPFFSKPTFPGFHFHYLLLLKGGLFSFDDNDRDNPMKQFLFEKKKLKKSLELMKVFSVTLWSSCVKVEMSKIMGLLSQQPGGHNLLRQHHNVLLSSTRPTSVS